MNENEPRQAVPSTSAARYRDTDGRDPSPLIRELEDSVAALRREVERLRKVNPLPTREQIAECIKRESILIRDRQLHERRSSPLIAPPIQILDPLFTDFSMLQLTDAVLRLLDGK